MLIIYYQNSHFNINLLNILYIINKFILRHIYCILLLELLAKEKMHMDSENYGKMVKSLRLQAGLTQNQVAESLGVTPGYISNVENNRTAMSLRILTYYARLVGCSLDSLVGELEPEYSETALDRKLYDIILQLDTDEKEKLLKTIEIWTK